MKKFIDPIPASGFPVFSDTGITTVLQNEIWDVLSALSRGILSPFATYIVDGGVVSDNGDGTFNIASGIVFLNDDYFRFDAAVNQPFPSYILADTEVTVQETYADAVSRDYTVEKKAVLSAVSSGFYVPITDPINSNIYLKTFLAKQGDLNVVTTARANEAKSRPLLVANVDSAGVISVIYAASGTWTASNFATGIYEIKQDAGIPVETAVIITPTEVGTANGVAMSYKPTLGRVKSYDINTGNAVNKGFSIVIYPL